MGPRAFPQSFHRAQKSGFQGLIDVQGFLSGDFANLLRAFRQVSMTFQCDHRNFRGVSIVDSSDCAISVTKRITVLFHSVRVSVPVFKAFQGAFRIVSWGFQGCFIEVSNGLRVFRGCFNGSVEVSGAIRGISTKWQMPLKPPETSMRPLMRP